MVPIYWVHPISFRYSFKNVIDESTRRAYFYSKYCLFLPFLLQVERVSHRDNLQSFVQKSQDVEKRCLAKAIKSYCELRVLPYVENRTVVF